MLNILGAVSRWISRVSLGFAALGLIVMVGIITWQVFARYGLQASPAWSEQAALAIMLWYVLIAAAVGVRERFHIALTSVFELLPGRLGALRADDLACERARIRPRRRSLGR
jgi:TRAP-type C4-dicarboxylate transport system permease small subunit